MTLVLRIYYVPSSISKLNRFSLKPQPLTTIGDAVIMLIIQMRPQGRREVKLSVRMHSFVSSKTFSLWRHVNRHLFFFLIHFEYGHPLAFVWRLRDMET